MLYFGNNQNTSLISCQLDTDSANKGLQAGMSFAIDETVYCFLYATHHRAVNFSPGTKKAGVNQPCI
jgi:hypothetical protein